MPQHVDFAALPRLDLAVERARIDLKVVRERLESADTQKESRLDAVIRLDTGAILGVVPHDRPFISYGEMMGFVTDQLATAGLPWKLKDNVLTEKGELFQTYVFDRSFTGPDGSLMDPMVIFRANYLNKPGDVEFGDYRFACANGVSVGKTIARIHIGTKQTADLARLSLRDQLSISFDRFEQIHEVYKAMGDTLLSKALKAFVRDEHVPKGMKKLAIETLSQQGFLTISDQEGKVRTRLIDEEPDEIYRVAKEGTKFDLFNALTFAATHQAPSINAMTRQYRIISQLFAA
jgi:hypothetical protein